MAAPGEPFDDAVYRVNGHRLGPKRWEILSLLRKREGKVVRTASFLMVIYDGDSEAKTRLKQHICQIKKALAGTGYGIRNHRSHAENERGYSLVRNG